MTMTWVGYIVLGLIVGAVAKFLLPGRDPGGIIVTTLIGIAGSFLGGFLGEKLGFNTGGNFFEPATWITALVGALILLVLYRLVFGRKQKVRR